ncbi:protein of unknown function [Spirosomataceae bacterium TFI 002]|nr:protein of unknown function [Spirosomataceae bacterium TFI 002]
MRLIYFAFFVLYLSPAIAQDLAVKNIQEDMITNANAIVRYDNLEFEIKSKEETVTKRTWAITILNEKGEKAHGTFKTYYDKLSKIKDIECALYDLNGKEIRKLRRGDIRDIGLGYASDEVIDNRIKIASFDDKRYDYPYTVVFNYVEESKNSMFYPTWYPIRAENTSLEKATFTVLNPNSIPFRFKETNYNGNIESDVIIANTNKTWTAKSLKAYENESMSYENGQIGIVLAPAMFELDGKSGDLKSWESASNFYYRLNDGRQKLPSNSINKVKELTAGITDPVLIVKKVYEYMQSHTRYMSIQLGVGGWQTIPAEKVAMNGYGDCKALTNYTVALLHELGLKDACAALVRAGKSNRFPYTDFSRMDFNHVIACIPMKSDTIWLECTSQTNPFGYLGSFTGNRTALLIKPQGGELVKTKTYSPIQNLQKRLTEISVSDDGSATIMVNGTYMGLQQETRNSVLEQLNTEDQKKWLLEQVNLPNFELVSFSFDSQKESLPVINEKLEIVSRKFASKSGKRMFVKLNPISTFFPTPPKLENRVTDIYLNENIYSIMDIDSIVFHLPKDVEVEHLPKSAFFESEFGSYEVKYERNQDVLVVNRKVTMTGGTYPASKYNELYEFIKSINKADAARAVILLGET